MTGSPVRRLLRVVVVVLGDHQVVGRVLNILRVPGELCLLRVVTHVVRPVPGSLVHSWLPPQRSSSPDLRLLPGDSPGMISSYAGLTMTGLPSLMPTVPRNRILAPQIRPGISWRP